MAVTSSRTIQITLSGDVDLEQPFSAADNPTASGVVNVISLTTGVNTIIPPTVSGVVNKGVMIIPPAANAVLMTMKGAPGDTGLPLHLTDPTSLAIDTTFAQLVLSVPSNLVGLRLIWT